MSSTVCAGEGGTARLGLDVAGGDELEVLEEVGPGVVVRHDFRAGVRPERRLPALLALGQLRFEGGEVGGVGRGPGRVELRQARRDRPRDDAAVLGVEPVVRVAERVDVAHGARDGARGALEDVAPGRGVEVARAARPDLVVAALVDQRRQVADLELEAGDDEEVRLRELEDERRLGLDEVRVLVALREREDLDAVAADGLGDRREVLEARDDLHRREGRRGGQGQKRGESDCDAFHAVPQKGWAPWAPMANWICRKPSLALMPGAYSR